MKSKKKKIEQLQFMTSDLGQMLDKSQGLYKLSKVIPWEHFEEEFSKHYCLDNGRPAKSIRLMVGLLILKQLEDLSDEVVVNRWVRDPYYQYFCGEETFQWELPCDPSDLTYFRKRIGEEGVSEILKVSISIHGKAALEKEVVVDTTVQEKNITYPVDSKQHIKIINKCNKIFIKEGIKPRRNYVRTVPKLRFQLRFTNSKKKAKLARSAKRKLKTIAGRLIREIERKVPADRLKLYREELDLFKRFLKQEKGDKNKIYSLHEPSVCCFSKGKAHKRYEFGSKSSIIITKDTGIIVGAKSFSKNIYDGHTLESCLEQVESLTGVMPQVAIADQTYKARKFIGETEVVTSASLKKELNPYQKRKRKKRLRRRAAIEPIIGHLKSDHRLRRSFLKGEIGDSINLIMAAAAFNFKKWLRAIFCSFFELIYSLFQSRLQTIYMLRCK